MADNSVASEVAGRVVRVEVKVGDTVAEGDSLIVIEAMKMEIPVDSPVAGRVKTILFNENDTVPEAAIVVIIES